MEQIKLMTFRNDNSYTINRKQFDCIELSIPTNGDWMRRTNLKAYKVLYRLNRGQANTSGQRSITTVEIDNLMGQIAERACETLLKWKFGDQNIIQPPYEGSINQIDIKLINGKTIEVRSSCVRNGIDFALFAKNKDNAEQQYFDVIGPYSNGYKPGERLKDYYMRVLYCCDKNDYISLLKKPILTFYFTGGATKSMMQDKNYYQIKHLVPAGGQVKEESDYKVIPLGKSLDATQFLDVLAKENDLISQHNIRH